MQQNAVRNFSTQALPESQRLDAWNALLADTYQGMKAMPARPGFEAELFRRQVGPFTLARVRSPSVTVTRQTEGLHSSSGKLIIQLLHAGRTTLQVGGGTIDLLPGDVTVGESDSPYTVTSNAPHDVLLMEFDRRILEPLVPDLKDKTSDPVGVNPVAAAHLRNVLLTLSKEEGGINLGACAVSHARVLTNLTAALFEGSEQRSAAPISPLVGRFRAIVSTRYAEPDLSVNAIARELGMSLRMLQIALARTGSSPLNVLLVRRLDRAAELLVLHRGASVTEIAFSVGFNDSAYFGRRFRERFGRSPREFRKSH